jgi:hypothetical protein
MSFRSDIRAMTRRAISAKPFAGFSGAAIIPGGLLLLSAP